MKTLRLDGTVEESKRSENFLKLSCHIQNDTSFLQQALENVYFNYIQYLFI